MSFALPSSFDIRLDSPVLASAKPFLVGSMAGSVATCCIQPMDMVKTRIQLSAVNGGPTNPLVIGGQLLRSEGVAGFYKGALTHYFRLGPHMVLVFVILAASTIAMSLKAPASGAPRPALIAAR